MRKRIKICMVTALFLFAVMIFCSCNYDKDNERQDKKVVLDKRDKDLDVIEKEDEIIEDTIENYNPDRHLVVCIDPGHYGGWNKLLLKDGTTYSEGDMTLPIALELRNILKEEYGIDSILTRDAKDINIDGYVNDSLDNSKISLRGKMAQGCDMFISIHTNANLDYANGYETLYQPLSLNKPIIILNQKAINNDEIINVANKIGTNITDVLIKEKLTTANNFATVKYKNDIIKWSDPFNDSIDIPGTLCYRFSDNGSDYYGVLRGANEAGVPGMIVEHSFHTIPEIRDALLNGDLVRKLAEADARGIAEGFGIPVVKD